jgi:hypothetical protein
MTESLLASVAIWDKLAALSASCEVSIQTHGGSDGHRVWQATVRTRGAAPGLIEIEAASFLEAVVQAIDETAAKGFGSCN